MLIIELIALIYEFANNEGDVHKAMVDAFSINAGIIRLIRGIPVLCWVDKNMISGLIRSESYRYYLAHDHRDVGIPGNKSYFRRFAAVNKGPRVITPDTKCANVIGLRELESSFSNYLDVEEANDIYINYDWHAPVDSLPDAVKVLYIRCKNLGALMNSFNPKNLSELTILIGKNQVSPFLGEKYSALRRLTVASESQFEFLLFLKHLEYINLICVNATLYLKDAIALRELTVDGGIFKFIARPGITHGIRKLSMNGSDMNCEKVTLSHIEVLSLTCIRGTSSLFVAPTLREIYLHGLIRHDLYLPDDLPNIEVMIITHCRGIKWNPAICEFPEKSRLRRLEIKCNKNMRKPRPGKYYARFPCLYDATLV
jgi:hypothetical protein